MGKDGLHAVVPWAVDVGEQWLYRETGLRTHDLMDVSGGHHDEHEMWRTEPDHVGQIQQ